MGSIHRLFEEDIGIVLENGLEMKKLMSFWIETDRNVFVKRLRKLTDDLQVDEMKGVIKLIKTRSVIYMLKSISLTFIFFLNFFYIFS